jgi:hypothetical protein
MKSKRWLFLLLTILSFASFWKVLLFGFFQDDSYFLWNGLYDPFHEFINFKHPGTPLEALIFTHLFGLNPVLWGLFGIALRVFTAYLVGVFFSKLTKSRLAGLLSAIFFSVAYAGASVVTSMNYHLPALVAICLLLSLIYFLKSAGERENYFWQVIIFLCLGIMLDPARAIPVLCIPPFLLILLPKTKKTVSMKQFLIKYYIAFFAVGAPILAWWFFSFSLGNDAQIVHMLRAIYHNPQNMIKGTKTIGHFFASITNLFTDVVYRLQSDAPKYETSNYIRPFGAVGVGIVASSIVLFIRFIQKKSRPLGIIAFCIFWTYLFYLPNWIAEPRAPMTSQHHYQFISAIGYICLVAYSVSRIKKTQLLIFVSAAFILLNIYTSNTLLSLQLPYRSQALIEKAMRTITSTVPAKEANVVLLFSGDVHWFENSILWDFGPHFQLLTADSDRSRMPEVTTDEIFVVDRLCAPTKKYPQLPVSHLYAWNIVSAGVLMDTTQQTRDRLQFLASTRGCTTLP